MAPWLPAALVFVAAVFGTLSLALLWEAFRDWSRRRRARRQMEAMLQNGALSSEANDLIRDESAAGGFLGRLADFLPGGGPWRRSSNRGASTSPWSPSSCWSLQWPSGPRQRSSCSPRPYSWPPSPQYSARGCPTRGCRVAGPDGCAASRSNSPNPSSCSRGPFEPGIPSRRASAWSPKRVPRWWRTNSASSSRSNASDCPSKTPC